MKKMKIYGLVGVAALAAIGGTFAYYSAEQTFNNPFDTINYSTSSTEKFNPNGDNKDWKPGSTVEKKVFATNTGDGDVWVRIKFDEKWTRGGNVLVFDPSVVPYGDDYQFGSKDGLEKFGVAGYAFIAGDSSKHQGVGNDYKTDGLVNEDTGSVVMKNLVANWDVNWAFNEDDGYFYYKEVLKTGKETELLLDSVTLCADTDMGYFDNPVYYIAVDKGADKPVFNVEGWKKLEEENKEKDFDGWKYGTPEKDNSDLKGKDVYTFKGNILDDSRPGYANADYELDITVDFIQTTEDGEVIDGSTWDVDFLRNLGLLPEAVQG